MTNILQIVLPAVLLLFGDFVALSNTGSSDGRFLYQLSIYLQQGKDPSSTFFPVLYKVVNHTGIYFIVKVNFKS